MLTNMKTQKKGDPNSLLYSYYTLAHSTTQQRDSPSPPSAKNIKKNEVESGDETDRSMEPDNEIHESFFMDEINLETESCSLNSSRENLLLDAEANRERRGGGSRPNSRPSSARRSSLKSTELPVDERIKVLEEGLKEADIEREVVLSCLGKEYLERLTMQKYLQEICMKTGYNYDDIKSNADVQSGAKNIVDNLIEMRTKAMLNSKSKDEKSLNKAETGNDENSRENTEIKDVSVIDNATNKETNIVDTMTEEKLKKVIAKVIQAEQDKKKIHTNGEEKNSHTHSTKGPGEAYESTTGANNSSKNSTVGSNNINNALETNKGNVREIVSTDQSDGLLRSADDNIELEKNTASQNDEKTTEKLYVKSEQFEKPRTLELKDKQGSGLLVSSIMPSMTDKKQGKVETSILQSLDKVKTSSNKSLDSIDEGIFMLKTFLTELMAKNQQTPTQVVLGTNHQDLNSGSIIGGEIKSVRNNGTDDCKPKRKLSLNDLQSNHLKSDLKPQRRRSLVDGMDQSKLKTTERSKTTESRLFRATVASQNKMKGRVSQRETESDTESAKKTIEKNGRHRKPKRNISRSATDLGTYSSRSAYTSTEEDSSVDGDDDFRSSLLGNLPGNHQSFKYAYEINQFLSDKEYTKLFSILNMLQDQKGKWEEEVRLLKLKIDGLKHDKSDLTHDNSVLRKSLEAANHAIKEINAKVQELKLTIVPLRDENSKLREQNHSLKSKLDLLRKDKAVLLQEFQELKKTKLKYEEKLQLVTDLYQNGRINLATDQNTSHPTEAVEQFSKGGLKALLEMSNGENEQSRLRRGRNQDKSKRHSFHGFDKIEELAGNAEELLAEKEKVEAENLKLKTELMDLKSKIARDKEENEENSITDEEMLNRRKGWRMQREESKHRIIREILKTESSQAKFGRPYSSCGDLTLADNPDYAGRSVWGEGKQRKPSKENKKSENVDERGIGQSISDKNYRLSKETKVKQDKDNRSSLFDDDGRQNGFISFEVGFKNKKKNKSVISWKEESEKIEKRLAMFRFGKESQEKIPNDDNNGTNKESLVGETVDTAVSKEEETEKYEDYVDNSFESEVQQKQDTSRPSTQWPIVKEKIQAIYGQPVDLEFAKRDLEYNNGARKTGQSLDKRDDDSRNRNAESSYSKYESEEITRKGWTELSRSKATRKSVQEMVARHVSQDEEDDGNENDWSRMESDWQRKSSDAENDFETYKEITKQRERAKNRTRQSRSTKSNITKSNTTKSNATKSNMTKSVSSQSDIADGLRESSRNEIKSTDTRNASHWVEVPVYLKKNKDKPSRENKHSKDDRSKEKTKTVEETITKVESAFSVAKAAGKKLFRKNEKVTKSKSAKDLRANFRRPSGTVMYLDELSDTSSDESQLPKTLPRRSKSFRKPRPKSDYWSTEKDTENGSWQRDSSFHRNRSLRLPKQTRDDMFAVDISIQTESDLSVDSSLQYDSFSQSTLSTSCQHQQQHHHGNYNQDKQAKHRIHSETGTTNTRSAKRPKSPGGFSCEMCRELNKKKIAQEKYCWEKYFPIGETTIDSNARGYKEDYV